MRALLGLRVVLTMFVAVLLPLEQAHCALMPVHESVDAVETETEDHDGDGHDCCPESSPSPKPVSPTDPCRCACIQLPAATAPTSISLPVPAYIATLLGVVSRPRLTFSAKGVFVRLEPDARSGSPPDPSAAPQSPRSPPFSA